MPGGWRMLGSVSASCLVILIVHLTGTNLSVLLLGGISLAGIWHIAQPWRGGGRDPADHAGHDPSTPPSDSHQSPRG